MTVTKAHITRRASKDDVPAKTVERDYVLAHAVSAIAATDETGVLVFKGGTSLRLIHFEEYRYSADLDYSIVGASKADALEVIQRALDEVRACENSVTEVRLTAGDPPRFEYVGPLKSRPRTLKLDLADDELVVNTESKPLRQLWSDLEEVDVLTYTLLEVAAESCGVSSRGCSAAIYSTSISCSPVTALTRQVLPRFSERRQRIARSIQASSRTDTTSASSSTKSAGKRSSPNTSRVPFPTSSGSRGKSGGR